MDQYQTDEQTDRPEQQTPDQQQSYTQQAIDPVMPVMPTWDGSDDMLYARKRSSLDQIRKDMDTGVLHPQYGQPLMNQLQGDLNSLTVQRQQAKAFEQQSATDAALHGLAIQQAVQIQNQQHSALAFPSTMYTHTGADGEMTEFYQKKPGEFHPIEKKEVTGQDGAAVNPIVGQSDQQPQQPLAPDGQPYGDQPRQRMVQAADGSMRLQTIPSAQQFAAAQQQPGGNLSVQSGPYTDRYQNGQLQGTDRPQFGAGQPAKSPARLQAEREIGRPEPPRQVMRNGRLYENPDYTIYQHAVNAATARIENDARQFHARTLSDAFTHANKAVESDAANPTLARMKEVVAHLEYTDPNHPRLSELRAKVAAHADELAAKDPAAMSLGELATATYGPHTNVKDMVKKAEDEVRKDSRVIPPDTTRGGTTYNPKGDQFSQDGPYSAMSPEGIHDEAQQRVRAHLTGMLNDTRKAKEKATAGQSSQAPQPPAAQPQQPAQSAAPKAEPLPKDKYTDAEIQAELQRRQRAKEQAKPAFNDQGQQEDQWFEGGFGSF